MKMGNSVSSLGIEPSSLAFWASMLTISLSRFPDVTSIPTSIYAVPCLRSKCRLLHSFPRNCKSFNAYKYTNTGNGLICTYTG